MKKLATIIEDLLQGQKELKQEVDSLKGHRPTHKNKSLRSIKDKEVFDFLALIRSWPKIVGERLSKHTYPKQNKFKTLTVLTSHPAYSEQLTLMSDLLIKKIVETFPALGGQIQKIIFHTNPAFFREQQMNEQVKEENSTRLHPCSMDYLRLKKEASEFTQSIEGLDCDDQLKEVIADLYIQMHRS